MDYTVVVDTDLIKFTKRIVDLIDVGWKPQGGVSLSVLEGNECKYIYYAQALIKVTGGIKKC